MNSEIGEKFLPIGTVVMLKGGTKRAMITGFCSVSQEEETKMYDYCGCIYPEGYVSSGQVCLFDHDQIEKVYYSGFVDDEEVSFKSKLKTLLEQVDVDALLSGQAVTPADLPNVSLMPAPPVEENNDDTKDIADGAPSTDTSNEEIKTDNVNSEGADTNEIVDNNDANATDEEVAPTLEEAPADDLTTVEPIEDVAPSEVEDIVSGPIDITEMITDDAPEVTEVADANAASDVQDATPSDLSTDNYAPIPDDTSDVPDATSDIPDATSDVPDATSDVSDATPSDLNADNYAPIPEGVDTNEPANYSNNISPTSEVAPTLDTIPADPLITPVPSEGGTPLATPEMVPEAVYTPESVNATNVFGVEVPTENNYQVEVAPTMVQPVPSQTPIDYEPYYEEEPTYQPVYDGLEDNDYDMPTPTPTIPIAPEMPYNDQVAPYPTNDVAPAPYQPDAYQQPAPAYIPEIQVGSIPVGVEPAAPEPVVQTEENTMPELMPVPEVEPTPAPAMPNMAADPLAGMVAPDQSVPNNM